MDEYELLVWSTSFERINGWSREHGLDHRYVEQYACYYTTLASYIGNEVVKSLLNSITN